MASSPTIGFPDYARLSIQAGSQLAFSQPPAGQNCDTGVFDCSGFGYLNITANINTGTSSATLNVIWWLDQARSQSIALQVWSLAPISFGSIQVPILTRWCEVTVSLNPGAPADHPFVFVYGTQAKANSIALSQQGEPIVVNSGNVVATGGLTAQSLGFAAGRAAFTVHCLNANKWTAHIAYFDPGGSGFIDFFVHQATVADADQTFQVILPPATVQINLINNDTVTHFMSYSLVMEQ